MAIPEFAQSDARCRRLKGGVIELSPKRIALSYLVGAPDWPRQAADIAACAYNRGACDMTDRCELHKTAMCSRCERHAQ